MRRVLLLGPTNSPHIEDMAVGLAGRGIEVFVAGNTAPNQPETMLSRQGIPVIPAPARAAAAPVRLARRVRWLRSVLRDVRPDVVHAHVLSGDPFFAVLAGARPLVATAWGSDVLLSRGSERLRCRLVVRRADLLTADSRALLEALAALGADRSRLRLVNWGVDLETFAPGRGDARSRLDLPDCPIVLSPRSLMPVYNPDVTIHAFGLVLKEVPYAMLLLKHYGEIPAAVQALLSKVPFRNRIRVVGRVPAENLPDYYRAANVTVSIASSDSSPRTVWEAMACGCPCVVSDLPWAHEWIKDGQDALVTAIEPSQVASSVIRLLRDEALAASLAHSGRQLVERHHARRSEIDRLVSEYTALSER